MTHPELKATFQLEILGVKKNPNGQMYSQLGVVTKGEEHHGAGGTFAFVGARPLASPGGPDCAGTIIEVNVSELGLVTPAGKVVWGKYAQVTNNPENDGALGSTVVRFDQIGCRYHPTIPGCRLHQRRPAGLRAPTPGTLSKGMDAMYNLSYSVTDDST